MPGVIAAISAIVASPLGSLLVRALLTVGLSLLRARLAGGDRRGARQRSQQTIRAAVTSAKWKIGTTRSSGWLTQIAWKGSDLQMTLVISEAPLAGCTRIWVQGRAVPITGVSATSFGTRTSLKSKDVFGEGGDDVVMHVDWYLTGASLSSLTGDAAKRRPGARFADDAAGLRWGDDMRMQGLAFVVVYLIESRRNERWRQGLPEIEFLTTGFMWAPPPRPPSTARGTPTVITNAADVRRWWEVEREGEPIERIDEATFSAARAICANRVHSYEVHGTVEADDDLDAARAALDFAWDGHVLDWQGRLFFWPGTQRMVMTTIPRHDILALPVIRTGPALHERVNRVHGRMAQWTGADWQPYQVAAVDYLDGQTRAGGHVLLGDVGEVEYVTNHLQMTRLMARSMREPTGRVVELRVPYGVEGSPHQYLGLMPGTTVRIDLEEFDAKNVLEPNDQVFRVQGSAPAGEDTLVLTLVQILPDRYTAGGVTATGVSVPPLHPAPAGLPPAKVTLTFTSQVDSGSVATDVTLDPGTDPGEDPDEDPGTDPSVSVDMTALLIETDRRVITAWTAPQVMVDGKMVDDPSISHWQVILLQGVSDTNKAGAVVDSVYLDEFARSRVYGPYSPGERYDAEVYAIRGRRRSVAKTANDTAPGSGTSLPDPTPPKKPSDPPPSREGPR